MMKFKDSCLHNLLLAPLILSTFFLQESSATRDRYSSSSRSSSSYNNDNQDYSAQNSKTDEASNNEEDFSPFVQSQGKIADNEVASIRIKPKQIVTFSYDGTYYVENRPDGFDFSVFDSFTRYEKLISIQLDRLDLSIEIIENLQKFAVKNIISIIIENCKIDANNCSALATWVASCNDLHGISITQLDSDGSTVIPLVEAVSQYKDLQFVSFVFKSLLPQTADAIARMIKSSAERLKSLTLGFATVEDCNEYHRLFESINAATELEELEYSVCQSTADHTELFFSALKNTKKLQKLKFYFDDFAKHDNVKSYKNAEIFRDALAGMTELLALDISGMQIPEATIQMLAQSITTLKQLQSLNISGNTLSVKSAEAIAKAVKESNELISLMMNDCAMTSQVFSALCNTAFVDGCGIKYLYLANNDIKDGIKNFSIDKMNYLVLIDLSNNNIEYNDAADLVSKTRNLDALRCMNFSANEPIAKLTNLERINRHNQLAQQKIESPFNHSAAILGI